MFTTQIFLDTSLFVHLALGCSFTTYKHILWGHQNINFSAIDEYGK